MVSFTGIVGREEFLDDVYQKWEGRILDPNMLARKDWVPVRPDFPWNWWRDNLEPLGWQEHTITIWASEVPVETQEQRDLLVVMSKSVDRANRQVSGGWDKWMDLMHMSPEQFFGLVDDVIEQKLIQYNTNWFVKDGQEISYQGF